MNVRGKIWILAAAALTALLAGACGKAIGPEDDGWTTVGGSLPISFSSSLAASTPTKGTLPTGTHFGVMAYYQPGTQANPGAWGIPARTPNFMFNQDVYYNGSTYTYAPIKYWPNNSWNTITFWAYCPYTSNPDLLSSGTTTPFTNTTTGFPDMRFTSDGTTDLLISDRKLSQSKPALGTPVTLTFRHVLSDIEVYLKKVDASSVYTVKLTSLSFQNISTNAVYRYSGTGSWNTYSPTPGSHSYFQDDPNDGTDDIELSTSFESIGHAILIPQVFSTDDAVLRIQYTLDSATMTHERELAFVIPLRSVFADVSPASTWTKNTRYTINITITPDDPIEFTVEWSDWGDVYNWHIAS